MEGENTSRFNWRRENVHSLFITMKASRSIIARLKKYTTLVVELDTACFQEKIGVIAHREHHCFPARKTYPTWTLNSSNCKIRGKREDASR